MIGYLGNGFLPARAGDIMRLVWAVRATGLHASQLLGTIVVERFVDVVSLGLIVLIGGSLLPAEEPGLRAVALGSASIGTLGLMATMLAPEMMTSAVGFLISRLGTGLSLQARVLSWTQHFLTSAQALRRDHSARRVFMLTVLIWCLDAACLLLAGQAVQARISPAAALLLSASLGLSTAVPSTPGYVGIFQVVTIGVLAQFGVSSDGALALVLLYQALSYLVIVSLGSWGFLMLHRTIQRRNDLDECAAN